MKSTGLRKMYRRHFKQVPFLIRSATMEWKARGFQAESAWIEATKVKLINSFSLALRDSPLLAIR